MNEFEKLHNEISFWRQDDNRKYKEVVADTEEKINVQLRQLSNQVSILQSELTENIMAMGKDREEMTKELNRVAQRIQSTEYNHSDLGNSLSRANKKIDMLKTNIKNFGTIDSKLSKFHSRNKR
jgi:chromosome segregation ATPase